ncbi:MAG: TonB-dependent receptor [Candidatus Solibacter usitatus]|nr:TonB-dependent receptor [Candidatus Solibacter usitatus]
MRTLATFAVIVISAAAQQDPRGNIEGQITDSTGAVIAQASLTATNVETRVAIHGVSNEHGVFEILHLNPGVYRLQTEVAGFKRWTQTSVEVRTGARVRIDIRLEVGTLAESVEVSAETPVLESVTSTVGQVLSSKQSSELPLRGGSLAWLYTMAPGVVLPGLPAGGPWNIEQASAARVAGGGLGSFDFNLDGVSSNSYGGRTAYVPPPDMVQELRIDTASYDAATGHSTGGSVNISLKSGTNRLHGTLGAWLAVGPMVTRNLFLNRFIFDPSTGPITPEKIKSNTPVDRWWRNSVAVGGPLYLPKIYDGRNRTFWMFGYQGHNRAQPVQNNSSVPTEAQRGGDFSALLRIGSQYQIYDPFTTTPAGARFQRQPVAGNVIPASRIDSGARGILKYFPLPNSPGTADGQQNYTVPAPKTQIMHSPVVRIDHNFSDKDRLFFRYSHTDFAGHFDELVKDSNVRGRIRSRPHRGAALDNVWVIAPQLVLDTRYGFTWFREYQSFDNIGFDLKQFGFPQSLIAQLDPQAVSFPQINVNGLLQLGNDGGFRQTYYSHSLLNTLSWTKGLHAVRFGVDARLLYDNSYTFGNVSPRLNFDQNYTRGPLDNSTNSPFGQGLASMLFGIPTGGFADSNDSRAESSKFTALFVQDDWRITKKLTLNLGWRWEIETPTKERFNRATRDFDFLTANPIEAQAKALYARSPLPEVPVSAFRTLGGVTFLGAGGNPSTIREPYYGAMMPRIGLAYQLTPRTVLRGGYGIFYSLLGADFSDVSQPGFNQRTNIAPTNNNGVTYVASIVNPFPSGLEKPSGAAGGLLTFLGRSPGFFSSDGRRPYTQRWNFNVQFEPMKRTVIEVGYMGSRSVRMPVSTNFNAVPARYLSTSPLRDQSTIDFLSANAANPFAGINGFQGTNLYTAQNTTRNQLLRPYPQFTDLSTSLPAGFAWYHALTARVDRRFSRGLLFQANYTWSSTMEALTYLNDTDRYPHRTVSDLDRPHRFTASAVYELPFGHGPAWFRNVSGGWQLQAIYNAQLGAPLAFGNVIFNGSYPQLPLPSDKRSLERWFNTSGFETSSRLQLGNNIRTFPMRVRQVREPGINLWDISLFKNIRIRESLRVQLRAEAEGAMNHPNMAGPNTSPANTLFGVITATSSGEGERRIFGGLKLMF